MLFINVLIFIIGGALVTFGADWLVDGASAIARKYHISEMVIGLTLVAFGTSMPELVVSLFAAFEGSSSLSIGNVVGSNIFNTLMVIGCSALIAPIAIQKSSVKRDMPFVIIASIVLCALALDSIMGGGAQTDMLNRGDGIVMLCFMGIFLVYSFSIAKEPKNSPTTNATTPNIKPLKSILLVVAGLFGLVFGGHLFVKSACEMARQIGISEAVIGLTLVAGGTSLPELVTSMVAARKGLNGIAVGNVVGSNLFNIFLILGLCSAITPLPLNGVTWMDFALLLFSAILMLIISRTRYRISRWEGLLMVLIYVGYIAWLCYNL